MSDAVVIELIRKVVTVDCSVEEAFRIFTSDAKSWWPIETHSIHGEDVHEVVFEGREGGEVYERSSGGEKGHWAEVTAWEPPARLVLAWNVAQAEALPTEVEVRFSAEREGTRVELEHRGWEALAEGGTAKRDSYDTGWDFVLGRYVARIA
jgi:uncharacterized protein YndB with AHSA1/START domain